MKTQKVLGDFFDLASAPFWSPKGGPMECWFAHWRSLQLLDQLGLTLLRIRGELAELKNALQSGGFAAATSLRSLGLLNLDEETFYRMVITLVDNVAALTPVFLQPAIPLRISSIPLLMKALKQSRQDETLYNYLDKKLSWYRNIKKSRRNPLTHVGAFRYVSGAGVPSLTMGTATIPDYEKTKSKPVKEEVSLEDFTDSITQTLVALFEFLDFWTTHFQPRKQQFRQYMPDYSTTSFSGMYGFQELEVWLEGEVL